MVEEQGELNRRRHPRMSVHWHGSMSASGESEDCLVLDISSGGARVQCSEPFADADCVTLRLSQGDHHTGTVVWRQGSFMGLAFDEIAAAA